MVIFAEITKNEWINEKYSIANGDNLTNTVK